MPCGIGNAKFATQASCRPVQPHGAADRHASDKLCEACHKVPDHASNQIHAEIEGCAACHSDHHGRNADLMNVADSKCTVCHANIATHVYGGEKATAPRIKDVTDFVTNHPEFKLDSPRKDPGPLKFSHLWHLLPGLPFGKGPYRLSDLSPQDREHYRKTGQTDNDLITLDCSACHELNRSEGSPRGAANGADIGQAMSTGPMHAAGDYMLPINYEMHCRACHPLTYSGSTQPAVAAVNASETERLAAKAGETVPHGWTDNQLRQYLERVLSGQLLNQLRCQHAGEAVALCSEESAAAKLSASQPRGATASASENDWRLFESRIERSGGGVTQ